MGADFTVHMQSDAVDDGAMVMVYVYVYVTGNVETQAVCKLPENLGSLQIAWIFRQFADCLGFQEFCKLPGNMKTMKTARQYANCLVILQTS